VLAQGFFWIKERGQRGRKKSRDRGAVHGTQSRRQEWVGLGIASASFAADDTAAPYPERPNTVLLAGRSGIQPPDLEKLGRDDKTNLGDWGFLRAGWRRGAPDRAGEFARHRKARHAFRARDARYGAECEPGNDAYRHAKRKVGFVAAEAVSPLGSDQLCYGKDASGGWKIVGMIGGE